MIVDNGKYYLYRHIRLDKNEPFYIGIGTKSFRSSKDLGIYFRAYNKVNRTQFWKNIINKTSYVVEILLESNDYNFICNKEIEFIKLYGRLDLKLGPLVNMRNGEICPKRFNKKVAVSQYTRIKNIKDNLEFNSIKEASLYYKIHISTLSNKLKSKINSEFIYLDKPNKEKRKDLLMIKVIDKITGIIYNSCTEAAKAYGYKRQRVQRQLKRNSKLCKFKYYVE